MVFKLETIIVGILEILYDLDQGIASVFQIILQGFDLVFVLFIPFCRRPLFLFSLIVHFRRVKVKSTAPVKGMHHFCRSKRLQEGFQKVAKSYTLLFTRVTEGRKKEGERGGMDAIRVA